MASGLVWSVDGDRDSGRGGGGARGDSAAQRDTLVRLAVLLPVLQPRPMSPRSCAAGGRGSAGPGTTSAVGPGVPTGLLPSSGRTRALSTLLLAAATAAAKALDPEVGRADLCGPCCRPRRKSAGTGRPARAVAQEEDRPGCCCCCRCCRAACGCSCSGGRWGRRWPPTSLRGCRPRLHGSRTCRRGSRWRESRSISSLMPPGRRAAHLDPGSDPGPRRCGGPATPHGPDPGPRPGPAAGPAAPQLDPGPGPDPGPGSGSAAGPAAPQLDPGPGPGPAGQGSAAGTCGLGGQRVCRAERWSESDVTVGPASDDEETMRCGGSCSARGPGWL